MKALTVLIALMLAGAFLGFAPRASAEVLIQEQPAISGNLHQFFIAVHRPDGTCETVEVYAENLGGAMNLAKEKRCIASCIAEDMTANFKYVYRNMYPQTGMYCPLW